jgi:tRNA pseudouridine65 synthase
MVGDTSHGDGRHNRHFRLHGIHRMLLHASALDLMHPVTGAPISALAPLDAQWRKACALFGWEPDTR